MNKLLLVEDDVSLGQTLQERLTKKSYEVVWAKSIAQARERVKSSRFDLIILDVGLPDGSGFDFAKEIKKYQLAPLIFVTAMASAQYRLLGFELGAEEYIPKPFHLKELFMRIKHVLDNHAPKNLISCGDRQIDFERMVVIDSKRKETVISTRDFQLLQLLIKLAPRVVSRDDILDSIWGEEKFPTNRTVDNIIVRLRQLLKDDGKYIRSVRGVGYQWMGETGDTRG
ncbi:MAG: response regulator transcription factor [Oligoflexia bacterium]|nr:response regulator transcription factor [Oligoflexia bacterium]